MAVNISTLATTVYKKIKGDESLLERFKKNGLATIKSLVVEKLTSDEFKALLEKVTAKLTRGKLLDAVTEKATTKAKSAAKTKAKTTAKTTAKKAAKSAISAFVRKKTK